MNTQPTQWGLLRPLETCDVTHTPDAPRFVAVPVRYALVPTVRQEGSYVLSPEASRVGFLPLSEDMPLLVEPSLLISRYLHLESKERFQREQEAEIEPPKGINCMIAVTDILNSTRV